MNLRPLCLALAGTVTLGSLAITAQATPFTPFDVRSSGMGGTGVASAKPASAALFNPAMLSAQVEGDKFQFVMGAGAAAADSDNLFDQVDAMQLTIDDLDASVNTINSMTINLDTYYGALATASGQLTTLSGELTGINGDSLVAGLGAGLGVGVPGKRVGVGVFVTANGYVAATPLISPADTALLDRYGALLSDGTIKIEEVNANPDLLVLAADVTVSDFNPQSSANGVGVVIAEFGVALSREFVLGNGGILDVGVTPKAVDVTMYDYTDQIDQFDDGNIDSGTYETTDSGIDLDAGVVYKTDAASEWQYGLVVKNLIGGDYATALGRHIKMSQQVRAGVARMKDRYTLAVDLDITTNDGVAPGTETQFLALGAEYDLKYVQARCGYRANLTNSKIDDAFSAGLGLGPIDLSVIGNADDVGAYLQLGFGW